MPATGIPLSVEVCAADRAPPLLQSMSWGAITPGEVEACLALIA